MRIRCYNLLSLLAIFLPLLACLFTSRPANALEVINLSDFDVIYDSDDAPYCRWRTQVASGSGTTQTWSSYSSGYSPWISANANSNKITGFTCKQANQSNLEVARDDFIVYTIRVKTYRQANDDWYDSLASWVGTSYINNESDVLYSQLISESINENYRDQVFEVLARSADGTWNPDVGWMYANESINNTNMKVFSLTQFRSKSDSDIDYSSQISSIISAINSQKNTLGGKLDTLHTDNSSIISAINNMSIDIQNSTDDASDQAHEDYEDSKQREEDKQDELEDQSGDVNISASAIANPFASLFGSPNCAILPTLASWLHTDANKIKVCSPYPQQFRPIIEFVSSAIVVGLLIRVYYKQLKGGYAS